MRRPAFAVLLLLTFATMLPVTAVVPVLKRLVPDIYGVGEFGTSLFLSLNMLGVMAAAPAAGWVSDRFGWTRRLLAASAAADALLWWAMSSLPSYGWLVSLRVAEGAAHGVALSMLLTVASRTSAAPGRRARMGAAGAALLLGVAFGAPLGGLLGERDATRPLVAGAVVMLVVALLAVPGLAPAPPGEAHATRQRPDLLHASRELRLPYAFSFVDRLTVGFFVLAFPLLAAGVHGLPPTRTGFLIAAFMLPFAMLNYPAARLGERLGALRLVLAGSALYGLLYAAVPWCPARLLPVLMVGCGVLSAAMFGPTLVLVVARSTPTTRASAVAGFNVAGSVGFLIGPLVAGALLEGLGGSLGALGAQRVTFAVGGATQLVVVAWAMTRAPRGESRERDPEP